MIPVIILIFNKRTDVSAQDYIQNKVIQVAKERVFDQSKSISEIAYELVLNIRNTFQDYLNKG